MQNCWVQHAPRLTLYSWADPRPTELVKQCQYRIISKAIQLCIIAFTPNAIMAYINFLLVRPETYTTSKRT